MPNKTKGIELTNTNVHFLLTRLLNKTQFLYSISLAKITLLHAKWKINCNFLVLPASEIKLPSSGIDFGVRTLDTVDVFTVFRPLVTSSEYKSFDRTEAEAMAVPGQLSAEFSALIWTGVVLVDAWMAVPGLFMTSTKAVRCRSSFASFEGGDGKLVKAFDLSANSILKKTIDQP
jgi:hypothetical protein